MPDPASPGPILYSFRRCPYAMRARLALLSAGIHCELREIVLARKPVEMLAASAKGTVPVLITADGRVIDESLDVMLWALEQHDPDDWLAGDRTAMQALIDENDQGFKPWLDRYKYFTRYPPHPQDYYLQQALPWLEKLDARLQQQACLFADRPRLADMALFPFIRQFAHTNLDTFEHLPFPALQAWFTQLKSSELFTRSMKKFPEWQPGSDGQGFG